MHIPLLWLQLDVERQVLQGLLATIELQISPVCTLAEFRLQLRSGLSRKIISFVEFILQKKYIDIVQDIRCEILQSFPMSILQKQNPLWKNLTHNFHISVCKFKLNPNLFLYFYTFLVAKMVEQRVELRTIFIPFKEVNINIQR